MSGTHAGPVGLHTKTSGSSSPGRDFFLRISHYVGMPARPRVLVFAAKLGYQTRSFNTAAEKLGIDLIFITDRCHQLDDPWNDGALPVHFENPEEAAYTVLQSQRALPRNGILALGDRPG